MSKTNLRKRQDGFTIVELGIATLVFSTVLLLITYGLVRVGKAFTKSVTTAQTQEVARTIIDDVSQAIQFSGGEISNGLTGSNGSEGFCVGNRRYSFVEDQRVGAGTAYGFVVDTDDSCNGATPAQNLQTMGGVTAGSRELMGQNMSLDRFELAQTSQEGYWTIRVRVVYGEYGVDLEDPNSDGLMTCMINAGNSEYCAVTDLQTTVQKRVE